MCFVKISKISIDANGALFFHDGYKVRNQRGVRNRENETNFVKLVNFLLNYLYFRRMEMMLLLPNKLGIRSCQYGAPQW